MQGVSTATFGGERPLKEPFFGACEVAKAGEKRAKRALRPQKPSLEQLSEAAKGLLQQKQTVEHWEGLVIGLGHPITSPICSDHLI